MLQKYALQQQNANNCTLNALLCHQNHGKANKTSHRSALIPPPRAVNFAARKNGANANKAAPWESRFFIGDAVCQQLEKPRAAGGQSHVAFPLMKRSGFRTGVSSLIILFVYIVVVGTGCQTECCTADAVRSAITDMKIAVRVINERWGGCFCHRRGLFMPVALRRWQLCAVLHPYSLQLSLFAI